MFKTISLNLDGRYLWNLYFLNNIQSSREFRDLITFLQWNLNAQTNA